MSMAHPPAIAELSCLRDVPRRGEPALDVRDDVVDVLQADRKPHIALGHAGRELLCWAELRMRRGRGMNGEASRIADIGDVVEQLQRVDEAPPGFLARRQLEADEAAIAALQIFIGARRATRRTGAMDR